MTVRIPALVALVSTLAACGTVYTTPDLAVLDDQARDGSLTAGDLKAQLAEDEGPIAVAGAGFRATCDAELCAGDIGYLDVYVSEVMADPTTCTDATGEWIEVRNTTGFTVDLNGAVLEDVSSGARSTLSNLEVIAPYSYAVIGKGSSPCGVDAQGTFGSSIALNNGGDRLNLRRPDDALIDNVLSWSAAVPGQSYETSPEDSWRWLAATDIHGDELASPGFGPEDEGYVRPLAQVRIGDLQISEVMADPTCAYDRCEWIEVRNMSGWPVDLSGLVVLDDGGNEGEVDGLVIDGHDRVVLGKGTAAAWPIAHVTPDGFFGNVGLNNTGEQIFLLQGDRVLFATPYFEAFTSGVSFQYYGWGDSEDVAQWSLATVVIPGSTEQGTPGSY